jgi:hypothetical protein
VKQLLDESNNSSRNKIESLQLEVRKLEKIDRGVPADQADYKMKLAIQEIDESL